MRCGIFVATCFNVCPCAIDKDIKSDNFIDKFMVTVNNKADYLYLGIPVGALRR